MPTSNMPTVSVIMLAWNSGDYLQRAVDSVLEQTMGDLEIVLVDNGSTDGSVDRLQASRPDPRLRIFRQESNLGIAGGTNFGVQECRSPWIAIHDTDDYSHPLRLELALKAAAVDPTLDVITTGVRVIDENDRESSPLLVCHEPDEISAYLPFNMPVQHGTLQARREVFVQVPYRPCADICTDYDWISRVLERHRIGGVSLPLYYYRRHPGSSTLSRFGTSQAHACAIRLAQRRRAAGRPEDFELLCAVAKQVAALPQPLPGIFTHFARLAARDGFLVLASYHAALACRSRQSPANLLRFAGYLLRAIVSERGAWREAVAGIGKGPFWAMLGRTGFPHLPRY